MTWEEIIIDIRSKSEFDQLVKDAYLGADLVQNVFAFENSEEFKITLELITKLGIKADSILLDVGAGNGIATIAFARKGFKVIAIEPDLSKTIGAGAIEYLVSYFNLDNVKVISKIAEDLPAFENKIDLVYIRQAVHHAKDLNAFVSNLVGMLRSGGVYLAIRDHVIYDEKDKQWFLDSHPLHRYYGGENAYLLEEYLHAMKLAGLDAIDYWKYYDSPLNYLPVSTQSLNDKVEKRNKFKNDLVNRKLGPLKHFKFIKSFYESRIEKKLGPVLDERLVPGRPYSFKGIKK